MDDHADIRGALNTLLEDAPPLRYGVADHVQHGQSLRRRHRASIASGVAALLAVACVAFITLPQLSHSSSGTGPTAASTSNASSAAQPTPSKTYLGTNPSCVGRISLVSSSGQNAVIAGANVPQINLEVGDTLKVVASGPCGSAVSVSPIVESPVLQALGPSRQTDIARQTLVAAQAGTVTVRLTHAMCAQFSPPQPRCIGGLAFDGSAVVVVTAPSSSSDISASASPGSATAIAACEDGLGQAEEYGQIDNILAAEQAPVSAIEAWRKGLGQTQPLGHGVTESDTLAVCAYKGGPFSMPGPPGNIYTEITLILLPDGNSAFVSSGPADHFGTLP